jgi:AraC family transcriptional regulator
MLMNKKIYSDATGNELRLSSVLQTEQQVYFTTFSAKYVVSGDENYTINNRKVKVKQGEYVIGNKNTASSVLIDNSKPVMGICVDVAKDLINEVVNYQFENPISFSDFLFEHEWMAQKYEVQHTHLGYALQQLSKEFDNLKTEGTKVNNELFYAIAECIVKDQSIAFESFSKLNSVKQETNGRLFNFICDAKNYIDDFYLEKITIENIASASKLSEYHFIRLFKTIYNITPYQYILQKRLAYSKELLAQNLAIQDIAFLTSFADSAAYCKSFKATYGFTPKQFIKTN